MADLKQLIVMRPIEVDGARAYFTLNAGAALVEMWKATACRASLCIGGRGDLCKALTYHLFGIGPDQPGHFATVAQIDQRGPELYAERAPEQARSTRKWKSWPSDASYIYQRFAITRFRLPNSQPTAERVQRGHRSRQRTRRVHVLTRRQHAARGPAPPARRETARASRRVHPRRYNSRRVPYEE